MFNNLVSHASLPSHTTGRRPQTTNDRQGVVLLVVLSLLTLFLLIAITYVITATQYRQNARFASQENAYGDAPRDLLDNAALDLLRGSKNPRSYIQHHSLFEDRDGRDGLRMVVGSALIPGTFSQFVDLSIDNSMGNLSLTPGFYNGCVLTMINGPARGLSTRIIGYDPSNSSQPILRVMAFESDSATPIANNILAAGTQTYCLVNGRPFNGVGFGLSNDPGTAANPDPDFGRINAVDPRGWFYALLPNAAFFEPTTNLYTDVAGPGDADEDYDAPDYNNMHLALVLAKYPPPPPPMFVNPNAPLPPNDNGWSAMSVLPSFHRPELIEYWRRKQSIPNDPSTGVPNWTSTTNRRLLRKILLRPSHVDHPVFADSVNPTFDPVKGPWDVDNDADGMPDSIWVDFGFPPTTGADGRQYKPLFAVLCVDLDGRINLNAHGSLAHTQVATSYPIAATGPFAGGAPTTIVRGQGMGPADINLTKVFSPTDAQALIGGKVVAGTTVLEGRNGYFVTPPAPPGQPGNDNLSRMKLFDYWTNPTAHGAPMDLRGAGYVALDHRGQPFYNYMGTAGQDTDDPYELNLSRNAPRSGRTTNPSSPAVDNPFTAADLEQLLRSKDLDARSLPGRLKPGANELLSTSTTIGPNFAPLSRVVTTEAYHIPAPSMVVPRANRINFSSIATNVFPRQRPQHITDLLAQRLLASLTLAQVTAELPKMLPTELIAGLLLDVNRPFGNGKDDNGNGIVDEPGEATGLEQLDYYGPTGAAPAGSTAFDHLRNDPLISDPQYARQILARHLYVLMMLLVDQGYLHPTIQNLSAADEAEVTARKIAQWAINVVDFRDPDAIMSPFEYDVNPFNGWQTPMDGDPATDEAGERKLVWGCEYPELLLTETLAFHDRRVEDTDVDDDPMNPAMRDDPMNPDADLDRVRMPQGTTLIELYSPRSNPSTGSVPELPKELYKFDATRNRWVLDLERVPTGSTNPVWRLAVTKSRFQDSRGDAYGLMLPGGRPDTTTLEPDGRFDLINPNPVTPLIERIVWFSPQAPALANPQRHMIFYNRQANTAVVPVGEYAVVGPRPTTYVGRTKTPPNPSEDPATQQINIVAGGNVTFQNVAPSPLVPGTNYKYATGIIVGADVPDTWVVGGMPYIGFSVSEPLRNNYYPQPTSAYPNSGVGYNDGYLDPMSGKYPDTPLEVNGDASTPLGEDNLTATGTTPNYKTVYLQRLANPTLPWHQDRNPYLTVDWMPIELTVFNGEDDGSDYTGPPPFDPQDPSGVPANLRFQTRERGDPTLATSNVWPAVSSDPTTAGAFSPKFLNPEIENVFPFKLVQTLGYLNSTLGLPTNTDAEYKGEPPRPFPWLIWNNRPYVGGYELMLVPASSSARLTFDHNIASSTIDPYQEDATPNTETKFRAPFKHLLNFFQSDPPINDAPAADFYRIFEYIGVPSRFVGTEEVLNPTAMAMLPAPPPGTPLLKPPFNSISRYREPGKTNLNTIASEDAWNAYTNEFLVDGATSADTSFTDLIDARRGYSPSGPSSSGNILPTPNPNYPSRFMAPFRGPAGADLSTDFVLPGATGVWNGRKSVDATILRSLYQSGNSKPMFWKTSSNQYNETYRNPYFYYQPLTRMGNLFTTRSNVYAVWITVGYFEVLPNPNGPDEGHPDGFQLGAELGSDSGDIHRHRAFYIIDRSIPVGFERGENHNVERAILLKRFIE